MSQALELQAQVQQVNLGGLEFQQDPNDPQKWIILSNPQPPQMIQVAASIIPTVEANVRTRVPCGCPNCINPYRNRAGVRRSHICHYCRKSYTKTSHLTAHMHLHSGFRPYPCDWKDCGRSFTRSDELQRHRRIHTGERKYECSFCGKKFMRSDHKTKHERTHSSALCSLQQAHGLVVQRNSESNSNQWPYPVVVQSEPQMKPNDQKT